MFSHSHKPASRPLGSPLIPAGKGWRLDHLPTRINKREE